MNLIYKAHMVYDSVHLPEEGHKFASKPFGANPEREMRSTITLSVHRIRRTSCSEEAQLFLVLRRTRNFSHGSAQREHLVILGMMFPAASL